MAEKLYEVLYGIRLPNGQLRTDGTISLEEDDEDTKTFLSRDAIRLVPGQDDKPEEPKAEEPESEEPDATPAAKRKAQELGVNLANVEGSGEDGKITVPDVEKAAG